MTKDWGSDWSQWRYGRINQSKLEHQFIDQFSLEPVEAGWFQLGECDRRELPAHHRFFGSGQDDGDQRSGESGQPESPFYGDTREKLADGVYFNLPFTRAAVRKGRGAQADAHGGAASLSPVTTVKREAAGDIPAAFCVCRLSQA